MVLPLHLISPHTPIPVKRTRSVVSRKDLTASLQNPGALGVEHCKASTLKRHVRSDSFIGKGALRQRGYSESHVRPEKVRIPCVFKPGQHVVFRDKHGAKHYGIVHWTGRGSSSTHLVVGILTVSH